MTRFLCKACGLVLAESLSVCSEDSLYYEDGKPMLPAKSFYISRGEFKPEQVGDFLINEDSLMNTRPYLEMRGRNNGCCGRDGLDGINEVCQNGHEVATVRNDCWMPSHVILSAGAVAIDAQPFAAADGFAAR